MSPPAIVGENALAFPAGSDEETMAQVGQIANGVAFPMAMHAAVDLGLFDIAAAAGPGAQLTAADFVAKLPVKNNPEAEKMVDRILRLLATFSVVSCTAVGGGKMVYGLTPVARYFVTDEDGVSMGPLLTLHQDKVFVESTYKIKEAVLEGGVPFDRAHGMNSFQYPGIDKRFNEVFNLGMLNHSSVVMKKIVEKYKGFENLNSLVDVGGGLGHSLKIILNKHTSIKGINYDLPHVIERCTPHPRVENVGGDMFKSVPKADAYFIKWVLHDWDDDHIVTLLKNCYNSSPAEGKVIAVDYVVAEEPETSTTAKAVHEMDIILLSQNPGGRERTRLQMLALAKAAGFAGIKFECFVCNLWVMEYYK